VPAWIPAAVPPPAQPALDRVPGAVLAGGAVAGQFGILFVCTGNLCRSVMAERLARQGLRARLGPAASRFRVASAGTAGLDGCPVHPYTAEALGSLGADADGAASRALTAADVDAADLILTAGQEHRDAVVALRPRSSRRAYLLREFARLAAFAVHPPAAQCVADQARSLVAEVAKLRGLVPYTDPAEDEIADPVTSSAAFLDCARIIDSAVGQVVDSLCGGLPRSVYRGKHAR